MQEDAVMSEFKLRPCSVVIEPCTPKAALTLSAELRSVIHERNVLTTKTKTKLLTALNELDDDIDDKNNKKTLKEQVIEEIFQTEVTYLKQLEIIMTYFMKPIREKNILSQDDFQCLFGNIGSIYDVNGALLEELKTDSHSKVAQAFCKMAPFFKLYSVYAYNYTTAMKRLQELISRNQVFSKFLDNQESRPEVQSKLSSLLITPVQRVPRYLLLLKQVLENTENADEDYNTLKECIEQLESTTNHINKQLDERENTQRLLELQTCLVRGRPNLIQANRKLIREGSLIKVFSNDPNSKEVYMILLSDILIWCKMKKTNLKAPNSLKCQAVLPLDKCKVKYHTETRYIKISSGNEDYVFYNKDVEENEQWFEGISNAIKNATNNRQSLRKLSSGRRAVFNKDVIQYHNPGISPHKTRRKRQRSEEPEKTSTTTMMSKLPVRVQQPGGILSSQISKRRSLRSSTSTKENENASEFEPPTKKTVTFSDEQKDSLFPLREYLATSSSSQEENDSEILQPTNKSQISNQATSSKLLNFTFTQEEIENTSKQAFNITATNNNQSKNKDLFVFGDPTRQVNNGFRFKLGNILTGLGQSLRRIFRLN